MKHQQTPTNTLLTDTPPGHTNPGFSAEPNFRSGNGGGSADSLRITVSEGTNLAVAWSPDGKWVAFHAFWDGTYHLWIVSKDAK